MRDMFVSLSSWLGMISVIFGVGTQRFNTGILKYNHIFIRIVFCVDFIKEFEQFIFVELIFQRKLFSLNRKRLKLKQNLSFLPPLHKLSWKCFSWKLFKVLTIETRADVDIISHRKFRA